MLQLLKRWEREDFADSMLPWMRIEHWRFRLVYDQLQPKAIGFEVATP